MSSTADVDFRITSIRGFALSSPYGDGTVLGQQNGMKSIGLVSVETNAGLHGVGETYAGVYAPELVGPTIKFLEDLVVGRQVNDPNIIQDLYEIPFLGRTGLFRSVASAIDVAIWDILGKALEQPVSRLLNPHHSGKTPCYASGGSAAATPIQISNEIRKILDEGYRSFKLRIGYQEWKADLERVATARSAIGEHQMMLDAIMGTLRPTWQLDDAISRAMDLGQFGPQWLEEPLFPDAIEDLRELRSKSPVPIAAGEAYASTAEFQTLISTAAVDVVQFDVTHSGGFQSCIDIASRSADANLDTAVHVWGSAVAIAANAQLALSVSHGTVLEVPQVNLEISSKLWIESPSVHEGQLSPSEVPGIGVELTSELIESYPFRSKSGFRMPSRSSAVMQK